MVEVAGKTMVQRVVDALRESGEIQKIVVVGDAAADGVDATLPAGVGFVENVMLGVASTEAASHVLVSSSDIPLVTAEAISDFISRASRAGADFCYPIIPREECLKKYPGMSRTYLKTREGTFTGGNVVMVSPEFMARNEEVIKRAYAARKKVLSLALMIGLGVLARALIAQLGFPRVLSIPDLERVVGRMLGGRVAAVVSPYPEIGEDVDRASDLEQVRKALGAE